MPMYEYDCPKHGRFSLIQGYNDTDGSCPKCGAKSRRLVSVPSIRIAEPLLFFNHEGKEINRVPDSGINPPAGQPYPLGG